jgi:hypothetical protein
MGPEFLMFDFDNDTLEQHEKYAKDILALEHDPRHNSAFMMLECIGQIILLSAHRPMSDHDIQNCLAQLRSYRIEAARLTDLMERGLEDHERIERNRANASQPRSGKQKRILKEWKKRRAAQPDTVPDTAITNAVATKYAVTTKYVRDIIKGGT